MPDLPDYSSNTKEAISKNLSFNTFEITNRHEGLKEPKKSFISRITSKINHFLGSRFVTSAWRIINIQGKSLFSFVI